MKSLTIVIFAHSFDQFKYSVSRLSDLQSSLFPGLKISSRHCDSQSMDRLQFLRKNVNQWILFLDADCELLQTSLEKILELMDDDVCRPTSIFTGYYENPKANFYLQRVHNFVANCWVQSGFESIDRYAVTGTHLLGGIFLIYTDEVLISAIKELSTVPWGAEDKILSYQLISVGYKIKYCQDLRVIHQSTNSWRHFIRRAFLQGLNDPGNKTSIRSLKSKIRFWCAQLNYQALIFVPAILVHFLILGLGILTRRLPRANKLKL